MPTNYKFSLLPFVPTPFHFRLISNTLFKPLSNCPQSLVHLSQRLVVLYVLLSHKSQRHMITSPYKFFSPHIYIKTNDPINSRNNRMFSDRLLKTTSSLSLHPSYKCCSMFVVALTSTHRV